MENLFNQNGAEEVFSNVAQAMFGMRAEASCPKCGDQILGEENALCGNCVGEDISSWNNYTE